MGEDQSNSTFAEPAQLLTMMAAFPPKPTDR